MMAMSVSSWQKTQPSMLSNVTEIEHALKAGEASLVFMFNLAPRLGRGLLHCQVSGSHQATPHFVHETSVTRLYVGGGVLADSLNVRLALCLASAKNLVCN